MKEWHDFFVAQVGATAALTGLVFVALSVNITQILRLSVATAARRTDRYRADRRHR